MSTPGSTPKYQPPDLPSDEAQRLEALIELGLLDTDPEWRFDRITSLAKSHFGVDFALVSLVDAERQWFKSKCGFEGSETAREHSFCGHAILEAGPLVVEDARKDPRFAGNPLVRGETGLRFYAGVPLRTRSGHAVGTLCILGREPRSLTPSELSDLQCLAEEVENEVRATEDRKDALATRGTQGDGVDGSSVRTGGAANHWRTDATRRALLSELVSAGFGDGALSLLYQPVYSAGSSLLEGFQVSIGLGEGKPGASDHAELMEIARALGEADSVEEELLREACMSMRAWKNAGLKTRPVAVPCSVGHLVGRGYAGRYWESLEEFELRPEEVHLGLQAEELQEPPAAFWVELGGLRALGCKVHLVGWRFDTHSLALFEAFPFDWVQLDARAFDRSRERPEAEQHLAAAVRKARAHGTRAVLREVDREAQLLFARHIGCDLVQGRLFAPPVRDVEVAAKLLTSGTHPKGRAA
jgi:EAL domain-containing protein (putative c-di-GMP-specific phosphodiesterase class I)